MNNLMEVIGSSALEMHFEDQNALSFELPQQDKNYDQEKNEFYEISSNSVKFHTLETKDDYIARYKFWSVEAAIKDNTDQFIAEAHKILRHEYGNLDSVAGRFMALVHEKYDALAIAANAIENNSIQVFDALHVVEAMFPYISTFSVNSLLRFCNSQHEKTKNDMAGGWFYGHLEKLLMNNPDICRDLHDSIIQNPFEGTINVYTTSMIILAKSSQAEAVDLVIKDAHSTNVMLKTSALWALGQLLMLGFISAEQKSMVLSIVTDNLSNTEELIQQTAIRAGAIALPIMDDFDKVFSEFIHSENQYALCAIAETIFRNKEKMKNKSNFDFWCSGLSKISPSSPGGMNYFDYLLSDLVKDPTYQPLAISCLTEWLEFNELNNAQRREFGDTWFASTVSELANNSELLSRVITSWLLSDSIKLGSATFALLSYCQSHGMRHVGFELSQLDTLDDKDLLFLVRRMLGFVIFEDHLITLTLSFLNITNALNRTFNLVCEVLEDQLGYNYPHSVLEAIKEASKTTSDAETLKLFARITTVIDQRIISISGIVELTELQPSSKLRVQFSKARYKRNHQSVLEAQKKSIIRQLVHQIIVKAGVGSFSFSDGVYSDVSKFSEHSVTVTLPRGEVLDTIGYEMNNLKYRMVKRDSQ